jgi:hypothetical protein
MAKSTRNTGKSWTSTEVKQVKQLAKENTPTRVIGLKLGRTEAAIYNRDLQQSIAGRHFTRADKSKPVRNSKEIAGSEARRREPAPSPLLVRMHFMCVPAAKPVTAPPTQ